MKPQVRLPGTLSYVAVNVCRNAPHDKTDDESWVSEAFAAEAGVTKRE